MDNKQIRVTYYFGTVSSEKKFVRIYATLEEALESIAKKQRFFRDLYKVVIVNL